MVKSFEEIKKYINETHPMYHFRLLKDGFKAILVIEHGMVQIHCREWEQGFYFDLIKHYKWDLIGLNKEIYELSDIFDFMDEVTKNDWREGNYLDRRVRLR